MYFNIKKYIINRLFFFGLNKGNIIEGHPQKYTKKAKCQIVL